jgi:hypothetical protein
VCAAKVLLQSHVGADRTIGQTMEAREIRLLDEHPVPSAHQPVLDFQQGGFRNHKEALELDRTVPPESFSRVRTGRIGSVADLIAELAMMTGRRLRGECNDATAEFVCKLPSREILIATHTHVRLGEHAACHRTLIEP